MTCRTFVLIIFSIAISFDGLSQCPPKPTISAIDRLLSSSSDAGNQWFFNGNPIADGNNKGLIAEFYGDYFVRVTVNGCSVDSDIYTRVSPYPKVNSFTPENGKAGATITITGSEFSSTPALNKVYFNQVGPAQVLASTSSSLTVVIPANSRTGTIQVTVGSYSGYSKKTFTIGESFLNDKIYWVDMVEGQIKSVSADNLLNKTSIASVDTAYALTYMHRYYRLVDPHRPIFFSSLHGVYHSTTDGGEIVRIESSESPFSRGVAIDYLNEKIFWANTQSGNIIYQNLLPGGQTPQILLTGLNKPWDIDLDLIHGKIYWTEDHDGGSIKRANLIDGSAVETIVTGIRSRGIAVDPVRGRILFTEYGGTSKSFTAELDGSNKVEISALALRGDIDVDFATGSIFGLNDLNQTLTKADANAENQVSVSAGGLFLDYADTSLPYITSIVRSSQFPSVNTHGTASFRVTFSEPVLNFDAEAVDFAGDPSGNVVVQHITDYAEYDVIVTEIDDDGELRIEIDNTVMDFRGNRFAGTIEHSETYTVVAAQPVTLSPEAGPVGSTFSITGSGFSPILSENLVKFSNNAIATVTASTPTQLTVTVPSNAVSGNVYVFIGSTTKISSTAFVVACPSPLPVPTITRNGLMLVSSSNSNNQWLRNGVEIPGATANTFTVTSHADYSVRITSNGCTATSNIVAITRADVSPKITSFSPESGPAGTAVTINGSGFSAVTSNNKVSIAHGSAATVLSSTPTTLTFIIPPNTASGQIEVSVSGYWATSEKRFTVGSDFNADKVYWMDNIAGKFKRASTSDLNPQDVFPVQNPFAIKYAHAPYRLVDPHRPFFFTTAAGVFHAGAGGNDITPIMSDNAQFNRGVAIDYLHETIYLTNVQSGSVRYTNMISSQQGYTLVTGINDPWDVEIDAVHGKIYWTEDRDNGSIKSADLAGGNVSTISSGIRSRGIAIDPVRAKIFFTELASGKVYVAALDGSAKQEITGLSLDADIDVDCNTGILYGLNSASHKLVKSKADGTDQLSITTDGLFLDFADTSIPFISSIVRLGGFTTIGVKGTAAFRVTFSEPMLNFGSDHTRLNDSKGIVSVQHVSDLKVYDVTISEIQQSGILDLDIDVLGNLMDLYGNRFAGTINLEETFTVLPAEQITLSPTAGAVGTSVAITGTGFSSTPNQNVVYFSNAASAVVTAGSGTELNVTVPQNAFTGQVVVAFQNKTWLSSQSFNVTCPTPLPVPTVSRNGIELTSSSETNNQWLRNGVIVPGATEKTFTVSGAGDYNVRVWSNGCFSISETITLLKQDLVPLISSFTPAIGPVGTEVTIVGRNFSTTQSKNFVRFGSVSTQVIWSDANKLVVIVPQQAATGKIDLSVGVSANMAGNVVTSANDFIVCVLPEKPVVTIDGMKLVSSAAAENQWLFNEKPIEGAINQQLDFGEPGKYSVMVTSNGCSAISDPVLITSIVNTTAHPQVKVFPNPVKDYLNIQIDYEIHPVTYIELRSLSGKKLKYIPLPNSADEIIQSNISDLPSGIYILKYRTTAGTYSVKIVKL